MLQLAVFSQTGFTATTGDPTISEPRTDYRSPFAADFRLLGMAAGIAKLLAPTANADQLNVTAVRRAVSLHG